MKLKSAANNFLILGWDFSRTWYFGDIQVLFLKAKKAKQNCYV